MAKKVPANKAEILSAIADKAEITKQEARDAYDALLEIVYAGANSKEGVTLPGLGKFFKERRKARVGRNPQTGEEMKFPAKNVAKFRMAKACKDAAQ